MWSATRRMMKSAMPIKIKMARMLTVMPRWLTLSNRKSKNRVFLISTRLSPQSKLDNSKNLLLSQKFTNCLLIHLHQVSGRARMSKRVFFASSSVVLPKNSLRVVRVDLDQRLMSFSVVIHLLPNLNYCSMFTNLHQEVFTLLVREVQPLVSPFMSQKILKPTSLFLKVVL